MAVNEWLEGYAALFGEPDLEGDVIRRGAFAVTLQRAPPPIPMLVRHDRRLVAGAWEEAGEDARGLWVRGRLDERAPAAALARRLLRRGVDGLSIGFITRAARVTSPGRELIALSLIEISLVSHPMQPRARLARTIASAKEIA